MALEGSDRFPARAESLPPLGSAADLLGRSAQMAVRRSNALADLISRGSQMSRASSNPQRLGTPRREASVADAIVAKCQQLGGDHPIFGVLIANNGIAAVKFIRSIRTWAYQFFGSERAIALVGMATPEDMRIEAEHIRIADQFVEVAGGPNNNNYANVPLICLTADRANVDAIWPGWGHASENPELPRSLEMSSIRFLGPGEDAMRALGDKIGSTILAQAAGVPTIPWSGSAVSISFEECGGVVPDDVYQQACISNLEDALASCNEIGYPVMLKASWGGGGKGIRKVMNDDETRIMFPQVLGEVPGSPVFAMKLAPASRHLEVQLLADRHGNVVSLYSRDCSVQRRHQKIVEEGPVTKAPREVLKEMERCARSLARHVRYVGAATVEYLYTLADGGFFFLELNPRLQVEHPVTEWISGVNIPACQLMIGMGIPLHRIPDIRRVFNLEPDGTSAIDFETATQAPPMGHVVAVRVTSEDANDGFKPTCGSIDELSFRASPDVWGYFSVKAGGGIHEFSDSQFGHLFAKGDTRDAAIRSMVVALKEIKIRGEIRTTVDYTAEMVQHPDFVNNNISTGWLDARIATHVRAESPQWDLAIISGAVLRTLAWVAGRSAEYLGYLQKGQLPPARLTLTSLDVPLVLDGWKYFVQVTRQGPEAFRLKVGQTHVDAVARHLKDGGLLVQVDGASHVVHSEEEPTGTRLMIDSLTCLLANESDPSRLTTNSPGKIIKRLLNNEDHVAANQAYAEIEVMKMVMMVYSPAAGRIQYQLQEGAVLKTGDLIATLQLDDPLSVTRAQPFPGSFREMGPPLVFSSTIEHRLTQALTAAHMIMAGYDHPVERVMQELIECLDHAQLPERQWADALSAVQSRLPKSLLDALNEKLEEHHSAFLLGDPQPDLDQPGGEPIEEEEDESSEEEMPQVAIPGLTAFPASELRDIMEEAIQAASAVEQKGLSTILDGLMGICKRFEHGKEDYARSIASNLLSEFLEVEERFSLDQEATEQEVIDALRQEHSKALGKVVDIVVSHQGLNRKMALVSILLRKLVLPAPERYRPLLRRLAVLGGGAVDIAANAQSLLEQSLLGELQSVVARALSGLDMFAGSQLSPFDLSPVDMRPAEDREVVRRPTVVEGLYSGLSRGTGLSSTQLENKIQLLVDAPAAVEDALASLLDDEDPQLQTRALLTYIRRIYYPFLLHEPRDLHSVRGIVCGVWLYMAGGHADGTALLGNAVLVPSLAQLPEALAAAHQVTVQAGLAEAPKGTLHVILTQSTEEGLVLTPEAAAYQQRAAQELEAFSVGLLPEGSMQVDPRGTAEAVWAQVRACNDQLARAGYSSLSVLSNRTRLSPLRIGFWLRPPPPAAPGTLPATPTYQLDKLLCSVEPQIAALLELQRLSVFKDLVYAPSRNRQCHTFTVLEKRDQRSLTLKRVFLRGLVRQLGRPALLAASYKGDTAGVASAAVDELGGSMATALQQLNRLYLAHGEKEATRADWAHIFLSVLPTLPLGAEHGSPKAGRIASALRAAAASAMTRHGTELRKTAVAQWEIRLRVEDGTGAWRLVVSLPTGHETGEDNVQIYREVKNETETGLLYQSVSPIHTADRPGPLDGQPLLSPYPPLEKLQQKRLAARRHKTTYCYDFPSVFQNALKERWTERAVTGEPGDAPKERLVEAQEITMAVDSNEGSGAPVLPVERDIGVNDVGIVAWLLTLRSPECPQGRKIVAIANDITFNSGAFGPREDAAFKAATEYALAERLPVVYLAANSGARVGLATELKKCIRVEWKDAADPSRGFEYLWISEADYDDIAQRFSGITVMNAHQTETPTGERRWVVTDIVGAEDGLGVECLSGSGAIASVYARAFREGFTITLVSGRTVGIGAYLARLGRRCIQRADQPIILTGFSALNKLLGREVYTSQLQLGGPKVMGVNGVSHLIVPDDLAGVSAVLQWLSYTPVIIGTSPPPLATNDPSHRTIAYLPEPGEKIDPIAAIAGTADQGSGRESWKLGLFDRGTWCETHQGWAHTVITGRARLGGIAVGVIAVETQTTMLNIPADPGAPDSSERIIPQAGQVWYPDSALKTANAMEEFDLERLPLIIMANWRGFSGGQRDLFEGVLQAGSLIVESLRTYRQPVIIYLPPGAELRGGAWVVIDSQINSEQVEMYADPSARAGVLEPAGLVEIKFKKPDLLALMQRLDPEIAALRARGGPGTDGEIAVRQKLLLPMYHQVAVKFAEMHDTPVRMVTKGVLHGIVPWGVARFFLATRLKRRLAEEEVVKHIMTTDSTITRSKALELLKSWFLASPCREGFTEILGKGLPGLTLDVRRAGIVNEEEARLWCNDGVFLAWVESIGANIITSQLKDMRASAAKRALLSIARSDEGRRGLLDGLKGLMAADTNLRIQMRLLLSEQDPSSAAFWSSQSLQRGSRTNPPTNQS